MCRNAVRERISFFECGLTVIFCCFIQARCARLRSALSHTPKEARASEFAETSLRNLDLSDSQRSDDFPLNACSQVGSIPSSLLMPSVLALLHLDVMCSAPSASPCDPGRVSTSSFFLFTAAIKRLAQRNDAGALSHALWLFCLYSSRYTCC